MGTAASGLSEAVPQNYIHQSSHKRQAEYLPCRHQQTGTKHNGTPKGRKCRLSKFLIDKFIFIYCHGAHTIVYFYFRRSI